MRNGKESMINPRNSPGALKIQLRAWQHNSHQLALRGVGLTDNNGSLLPLLCAHRIRGRCIVKSLHLVAVEIQMRLQAKVNDADPVTTLHG